jgi:PAS domain S-box-containing protein
MAETTVPPTETRQQLHSIVRKEVPFDKKAREVLEVGVEYLDLDYGYLTRIDSEIEDWEVVITTDTEQFPAGLRCSLEDTYCRETITTETHYALHDASAQGWTDDPALQTRNHDTYLGIPLIVNATLYGTVCFVADDPRSEPFSDIETLFAEHLTRLLEREREREHVKAELTSQSNLAAVLNRVLRHNLRNDISVVRGNIRQLTEQLPDQAVIETTFEYIDSLIDLSEKARELEQIVTSDTKCQPTAVGTLVEDVVETVAQEQPQASLSVEYDKDISVALLPSFERAIRELLENATEHSDETPTVSVTIDTVPNAIEIRIADDGPGLPDMEAGVLTTGEETPLSHGSGLGLWLVHWIVTGHDGTIDTTVTEDGTTITLSVPRIPNLSPKQQLPDATRGRDRFQAAFEEANDAILILNDDAKILNGNRAAETLFELDWEELVGRSFTELVPDAFDFDAEMGDFPGTGATHGNITVVDADGVEHTVEYSGKANIVPGEHLVVGRDITERKERERRYNAIFNQTYQFIGLLDPDGTVLEANETALNFGGLDREDVIGKPFCEADWWQIDDATQQELQDAVNRAATGEFVRYEVEVQGDEGAVIIDFSIRPITDDEDNVTLLIPEGRDITERKERDRELAAQKERYETLLAAAPDPVFVAEAETGEIVELNDAAETLLGEPRDQIIGRHQSSLHPTEDAELYRKGFKRAKGERTTIQTLPDGSQPKLVIADGETIPIEIAVDTVSLPDGPVVYGIFRNLSERNKREKTSA